jgi:hypothetical protein
MNSDFTLHGREASDPQEQAGTLDAVPILTSGAQICPSMRRRIPLLSRKGGLKAGTKQDVLI